MLGGRDEAIDMLRREQMVARQRCGFAEPIHAEDVLEHTLQRADTREKTAERQNGKIREGLFSYGESLEITRWARTRDVIRRVVPGTDEDPIRMEMIARQAASVEMMLRQEHTQTRNKKNSELCDHVLICTIPTVDSTVYMDRPNDYFVVRVSAGLIDFLYQITKAVVLSWQPRPPKANAAVAFDNRPEAVSQVLAHNPVPLLYFIQTLSGYLFRGQPHLSGHRVPIEYQYPLQLHTNFNERFILAHEYAHTLINWLDISHPNFLGPNEEFAADLFAFVMLVESGSILDRMPPNFSTPSAFLVLTALRILREALDILRRREVGEDYGFMGHPPVAQRMAKLQQLYLEKIDDGSLRNSITPVLWPAQTLSMLWQGAQPYFLRAKAESQKLHAIWDDVPSSEQSPVRER